MGITPTLAEGDEFVEGRSQDKARELLGLAAAAGLEGSVRTTGFGYIVPSAIFAASSEKAADAADDEDQDEDENPDGVEFDPSAETVDAVKEYFAGADDTERERLLAAEADGKKRKGILDLATTPEGAK